MSKRKRHCTHGFCTAKCASPAVPYCMEHWREQIPALLANATYSQSNRTDAGKGLPVERTIPVDEWIARGLKDAP